MSHPRMFFAGPHDTLDAYIREVAACLVAELPQLRHVDEDDLVDDLELSELDLDEGLVSELVSGPALERYGREFTTLRDYGDLVQWAAAHLAVFDYMEDYALHVPPTLLKALLALPYPSIRQQALTLAEPRRVRETAPHSRL